MPLDLDHQLRERVGHDDARFPVSFFEDDFLRLENRVVPLHWHPEFEIMTAHSARLDCQAGPAHVRLEPGDSLLINANVLHGIRQLTPGAPDRMPNIVFSGALIAPEGSAIFEEYIRPVADCDALPFVAFRRGAGWQEEVNRLLEGVYDGLRARGACHEMQVQRGLSRVFECLYRHLDELPRPGAARARLAMRVRARQMQAFIRDHYAEDVGLDDIARAASVGRSEANRCFNACVGCSPVEALIQYRLEAARRMLDDPSLTVREVCRACGFNSESYFSRRYRRVYGCTPGSRRLGR